ncbi:MAG: hypothetical protein KAX26_12575 [Anaerolineae bacterium]|nr:hypothetical protein [Anaerolineae bacterium]
MSDKFLGTLPFEEFDSLIQDYIDRPHLDAISFEVLQQLADESNQPPMEIELTGVIRDGMLRLRMAQPTGAPLQVRDNTILINGLRLVIHLLPESLAEVPQLEQATPPGS